jgi:acetoin utilization deacetylase AcuC-like enzyme
MMDADVRARHNQATAEYVRAMTADQDTFRKMLRQSVLFLIVGGYSDRFITDMLTHSPCEAEGVVKHVRKEETSG